MIWLNKGGVKMECKNCGSKDIEKQGYSIIGKDRLKEWAKEFLDIKIYTCMKCKGTFSYKEK
jgi:hypothetical protein